MPKVKSKLPSKKAKTPRAYKTGGSVKKKSKAAPRMAKGKAKAKTKAKSPVPSATNKAQPNFLPAVRVANITAEERKKQNDRAIRQAAGIPDA